MFWHVVNVIAATLFYLLMSLHCLVILKVSIHSGGRGEGKVFPVKALRA
jgi:hypothetical protein